MLQNFDEKNEMSRRKFVSTLGMGVASIPFLSSALLKAGEVEAGEPAVKSSGGKLRNVVFILSDDHRYDFMGFMGKPKFLETPNMDRMAKNGAHIKNAFVTTSLCSPSRASILTGLYSHKHGVVNNQAAMSENCIFFPEYLQKMGYQTAFMGKWHMGSGSDDPKKGFDKWISFKGQGVYYDPEFNIDGEMVQRKGYMSDLLTEYAADWIREQKNKPFFLYLSHKAIHFPFEPAKRHEGKYENVKIEYPPSMADTEENYKDKPDWVRKQRDSWHGVDYMYHGNMDFDSFYKRYCETILGIDDSIGDVFKVLEEANLLDSTLIIYMGDNGFCMGEHGLIDKRQMYEESIRVPMLAHCPELIRSGSVIPQMVQNIDIAPTILDLAGVRIPREMDGKSFLPLLKGKEEKWRDAIFYEYFWEWEYPETPTVFGIRTDKYKYMSYYGIWDFDELYDIENDPNEMKNLIGLPEYEKTIQDLSNRVFGWLEETKGMQIPLRRRGQYRGANRLNKDGSVTDYGHALPIPDMRKKR
jgi:N-acetylglucosamine-6-sulfatase